MHVRCRVDRSTINAAAPGARWIAILGVALVGCLLNSAAAQLYRSNVPDVQAKNFQAPAARFAKAPANNPDRAKFDDYMTKWYFPALTRTDPVALGELPAARDFLFKQILLATNDPQLQAEVTTMAYNSLAPIIASPGGQMPYHPAVRYNAILMFGMLNEVYPNQGAVEKPYAKATSALISIVDSATVNANFPPPVILGALIGLERHARLVSTLPQPAIEAMSAATLKLVLRNEPIQDLKGEEFDWFRLRAAAVLAQLGNVGRDNQYYNGVLQLVSQLKSLEDRCEAAAMLAKFKYEGAKLDGVATSGHLLKLTADIAEAELARALEFEGGPSTAISTSRTRERSRGTDYEVGSATSANSYPRRPLLAHLVSLRSALTSTKPALPADTQAKFDAILAAVIPVIDLAVNKDSIELAISSQVREMSATLKRLSAIQPAAVQSPAAAVDPAL